MINNFPLNDFTTYLITKISLLILVLLVLLAVSAAPAV